MLMNTQKTFSLLSKDIHYFVTGFVPFSCTPGFYTLNWYIFNYNQGGWIIGWVGLGGVGNRLAWLECIAFRTIYPGTGRLAILGTTHL